MNDPKSRKLLFLSAVAALATAALSAADSRDWPTSYNRNWEEKNVGSYTLPDPLLDAQDRKVDSPSEWESEQRGAILEDFADLMYGHTPDLSLQLQAETVQTTKDTVDGLATRTITRLAFFDDPAAPTIELMVYVPNDAAKPVPIFVGLNWNGNAGVEADLSIPLSKKWMRPSSSKGIVDNRATEATRSVNASRWPLKRILERGYGVATFYYGDVEPDRLEGWRDGIRGYALKLEGRTPGGQTNRVPSEPGLGALVGLSITSRRILKSTPSGSPSLAIPATAKRPSGPALKTNASPSSSATTAARAEPRSPDRILAKTSNTPLPTPPGAAATASATSSERPTSFPSTSICWSP